MQTQEIFKVRHQCSKIRIILSKFHGLTCKQECNETLIVSHQCLQIRIILSKLLGLLVSMNAMKS